MSAALALVLAAVADTLVVGTVGGPVSLAPHEATDLVAAAVVTNVCEPLVRFRGDGTRTEPALATSWATRDGRTWTFILREGVRFHDGAPFDADAVIQNVANLTRERGFPARAERLGPHVVALTLEDKNAALLATLSQPFFAMQSPRQLGRGTRPVGTGPFAFTSASAGEVVLEAHRSYWGGPPRLRRLVFRHYPTADRLRAGLVAGDVDVTSALGHGEARRLRGRPDLTLDSQTGHNLAYLALNHARPPFQDVRVRRALARAIDRRRLVDEVLDGHGEPARHPLPPSFFPRDPKVKADAGADQAGALRLLAQAGLAGGFATTLLVVDAPRPYMPQPRALAERLREDLAGVGVRAAMRDAPTWNDYAARGSRGDYDLAVFGWQADTLDPNDFLVPLLSGAAVGTTNRSRYRSEAMDALLRRGRATGVAAERRAVYREVQALFDREVPWIPLYHVSVFTAYRRAVHGLTVDATGITRFDQVWKK